MAPRARLQDLCAFLAVEYEEAMFSYQHSDAAKAMAQLDHHKNLLMPVFASSVGRYHRSLTRDEIATIQRRLYSPMKWLGYLSYEDYEEISRNNIR
jgi:hypothetical protein